MRTLTTLAVLALTTATAAADHDFYDGYERNLEAPYAHAYVPAAQPYSDWLRDAPQNRQPQTEPRYQMCNQLAVARLAAWEDHAYIELPGYARSLDYLELRAGATPIALRDVVVRFGDGSSIHTGSRGVVEPFEGRVIDLPRGGAPVVAVIPHYQAPVQRGHATLQVFGVPEHRVWRHGRDWR